MRQQTDFNAIFKNLTKSEYNFSLISLIRAPLNTNALQHQCFRTVNFEKVLCRSAFRKQFGLKQCAANISTAFAHINHGFLPHKGQRVEEQSLPFENQFGPNTLPHISTFARTLLTPIGAKGVKRVGQRPPLSIRETGELESIGSKPIFKSKNQSETILNVHWAAEQLARSIQQKQNVKAVIREFIRDVKTLFRLKKSGNGNYHTKRSASALKGVKVVVKGRLGRKKKALAQQALFSAGVVPLSTVQAKIDFDQRVIKTKFGSLGLKLWLCYA
jgi:hypothetical protein